MEDLFSNHIDLFIPTPTSVQQANSGDEKFIPNPRYRDNDDVLNMYRFVGNLIGVSLRTRQQLGFELCPQIWKVIVSEEVSEEDIEMIDKSFSDMLQEIEESPDDLKDGFTSVFDLAMMITDTAGNDVELVPGGESIPVTWENRLEFVRLARETRLEEGMPAAERIAEGVWEVIPKKVLTLFTWEQLERSVKGAPEVGE